jgi:hypothetical protein
MKTYQIENLSTCEIAEVHTEDNLCSSVEEQLYILWELTPCTNRVSWAYPFLRGERVKFTYHNCEFVWVWMDKEGKVWVKDICYAQVCKALLETHKLELDPGDKVEILHNYADRSIVDIIVTDGCTGKRFTFNCFDTIKGTFPY